MRAFRILLALAAAAGTFYSLNVLAVQRGYSDRLDFNNRHYQQEHCHEHSRKRAINHHCNTPLDTTKAKIDTTGQSPTHTH